MTPHDEKMILRLLVIAMIGAAVIFGLYELLK